MVRFPKPATRTQPAEGGIVAGTGVPAEVEKFLSTHIDSIEELEILLLLHGHRTPWTPAAIAQRLCTSVDSATLRLESLRTGGLVELAQDVGYRFCGQSPHSLAVAMLAGAYTTNRVSIVSLVYAKPSRNVRIFADAFRLRPREKEDT